jgi:hypothetical protein
MPLSFSVQVKTDDLVIVFEDKELADQAVHAVEKEIHADAYDPTKQDITHAEDLGEKQVPTNKV